VAARLSKRPRSIVFLGTAHDNGGTSILACDLAKAMRAQDHQVEEWYLFASQGDLPAGARVFISGKRSRSPLVLIRLFWRVVVALRRHQPDTLFGLQPLANLLVGVAGRIAGIRNRIPTYHGPRGLAANTTLTTIDAVLSRLGCYTHMIACANSVAGTLTRGGSAYARLEVVVNGQNIPQAYSRNQARAALGLPSEVLVFGQIGRLSYQKNQSFSLDLLQQLPEVRLVLVGIGPDEALIRSQIEAAGLTDRVRIVPSIPHQRIGLFYSAVDLVLFPSRFEGLSLAAIEAIHAGVPTLCSDIASFREMFAASPFLTAQLLLPAADRSAWLARIRSVVKDQDLRNQIAAELARLSPAYSFEVMAEKYLRLIDQWDLLAPAAMREAIQTGL